MTYKACLAYLDGYINYEKQPPVHYSSKSYNLRRMVVLMGELGDPQTQYDIVHVAGSKGKGSTVAMIANVLRCAGYETGLYTSPHLVDFRERIQIGGRLITEQQLGEAVEEICPALERLRPEGLTYFESITAVGLYHFAKSEVDVAVLEVGMGGRLDATNITRPIGCCITTLDLEHTHRLGETLPAIAREKAGIIKRNVSCVTTVRDADALRVIEGLALQRNAELYRVNREFSVEEDMTHPHTGTVTVHTPSAVREEMAVGLSGRHQRLNAAGAIMVCEVLANEGYTISEDNLRRGVETVNWPGRYQRWGREPEIILDCAHSKGSAEVLAQMMSEEEISVDQRVILVGFLGDKDVDSILRSLSPWASSFVVTAPASPRALRPNDVAANLSESGKKVLCVEDPTEAFFRAKEIAGLTGQLLITGSVYLVGQILSILDGM